MTIPIAPNLRNLEESTCGLVMMNSDRPRLRQAINLVAIGGAFGTNILANLKPLNGLTIAAISDQYFAAVPLVPARYAFSIWGLIYLGLIALALHQARPSQRHQPAAQTLGYDLAWSSFAQILWVILFQYQRFVLSLGAILWVLVPLIRLYRRQRQDRQTPSLREKWLFQLPISIYLAWLTVATLVNTACVLYILDWQGWGLGADLWTAILLGVGTCLGGGIAWHYRDRAFAGVFLWAWVAIALKNSTSGIIPSVAIGGAILLGGLWGLITFRK